MRVDTLFMLESSVDMDAARSAAMTRPVSPSGRPWTMNSGSAWMFSMVGLSISGCALKYPNMAVPRKVKSMLPGSTISANVM